MESHAASSVENAPPASPMSETKAAKPRIFMDDTASILSKYADQPPSIELHIHSTHYRFNNQEGIIPKPNSVMDLFLESVKDGEIPAVAGEVFKDSGIPLYEGCAILKLVDYRNFGQRHQKNKQSHDFEKNREDLAWEHKPGSEKPSSTSLPNEGKTLKETSTEVKPETKNPDDQKATNVVTEDRKPETESFIDSKSDEPKEKPDNNVQKLQSGDLADSDPNSMRAPEAGESQPPSFRVLLRPTGCGLLNDLMCLSDTGTGRMLTDMFATTLESEILNLTKRNLDLQIPKREDFDIGMLEREPSTSQNSYIKHRLTKPRKLRKVTDDNPHKSTEYEDFMLSMANIDKPSRASSQFVRMSFVETLRRKKNINQSSIVSNRLATGMKPGGPRMPSKPPGAPAGATPGSAVGGGGLQTGQVPPAKINQANPSTLSRQLYQSQQIAQTARLMQQQQQQQQQDNQRQFPAMHVPPGPTAQHQIQAQQQQQAVMRARAQRQQQQQRVQSSQQPINAQSPLGPQQQLSQVSPQQAAAQPGLGGKAPQIPPRSYAARPANPTSTKATAVNAATSWNAGWAYGAA